MCGSIEDEIYSQDTKIVGLFLHDLNVSLVKRATTSYAQRVMSLMTTEACPTEIVSYLFNADVLRYRPQSLIHSTARDVGCDLYSQMLNHVNL